MTSEAEASGRSPLQRGPLRPNYLQTFAVKTTEVEEVP